MDGDEEEEGSDGEMEPEYSGMEQPPLTRMLKNILSEYPDDGQILKELIQNAEDAGASEVKILFDGRKVNHEPFNEKKKPFNKYFKGPALFFHNNAIFSDDDWRGIKMLYCSVKELDPLKVGRFGLGFKSVFHITDYPMVVSGKKLLVIDPYTTYSDKVCTSFLLKGLAKYKGMDMKAFRDAFDDIFGFGEETLRNGEYRGTLFRFPLRQIGTELSGNLYNKEKIESLFDSFITEAPMTLLFLKKLEEMTLYRQNHGVQPSYSVKFKGQGVETALEKRREFCNALRRFTGSSMSHDLICSLHVNISVETRSQQGLTTQEDKSWFIVNTVLGDSNMSTQLRALCQDEDLSYSPYVGIAIPYENITDFKGHVFCFLPLPLEERSLSGFPVHVNGFFALSQNRRHVKWPSADLKQSAISADKSLQWNQVLIKEALSQVYLTMVRELITKCTKANNPVDLVAMVYRSIPCLQAVDMKWRVILDPLVRNLLQIAFLYTDNNGGQWIHHNEAVFECPHSSTDAGVRDTLRQIMKQYKQNITVIPPHVTALLEEKTTMTLLTPAFLANLLRQNNWYQNCSPDQKLHLLQYLMSDQQYSSLEGLELLPLENGSFVRFETYGCVYMCDETMMKLTPGCEEQIVKVCLPQVIVQHLQRIQGKGTFQVKNLDVHGFARLLQLCIDRNFTNRGQFKVWDTAASSPPGDWLTNVWSKLKLAKFSLEHFKNLHLVPEKHGKYYHLHSLSRLLIVKSHKTYSLPEDVCISMARFSVTVLPALPSFLADHPQVTKYIHIPTNDSFLRLLDRLYTNNNAYVQAFNDNADKSERISWRKYLEPFNIGEIGRTSLRRMQLFDEFQNGVYTSVSQVDMLAPKLGDTFPVKFPRRLLSSSDDCQYRLAQKLGASQLTEESVIVEILSKRWHSYSDSDKKKLMLYFVRKMHQFQRNHILMGLAKEASFVPTSRGDLRKPSELYNPSISQLRELVGDDSMFPAGQFSSPEILFGLVNLGLKSSKPSSDLIITCINNLDRKVKQGQSHTSNLEQAKAVNHFLSQQSEVLKQYSLMDKKFLVPLKKTSIYPTALPWCSNTYQLCAPRECLLATTQNQRIVGSGVPLIAEESYRYLKNTFLLLYPQVTDVLEHLLQIKQKYTVKYKPDLMPCINQVYNFLAKQTSSCIEGEIRDFFSRESLVWTGETFDGVNNVYTTRSPGDIPLEPYMYCLPREFISIKHLFEAVGCHEKQTVEVLDIVQKKIKDKHGEEQIYGSKNDVGKDLNIVVQILTIYKQDPESVAHLDVLFPVHTGSDTRLKLMSASECRYSNEEWLKGMAEEDEETIYYVHADIPPHTAQTLGVRSLTEGLLTDTEGIEPCGQHEDLTGRIKGLLDGYTDGLSVPKELVQNADDAGATKICFLYDERENIDVRTRLIDENMSGFQGPALWAYNDAQFTEADLRNITKLGGATKQEDDTKVGKFGLGFCSVYNLTDVPSFITGSDLVIFDPHYRNLGSAVKGKEPGIKINLKSVQNQKLVRRMKNQFKPFNGVFGCDMTMGEDFHMYEGTLFRLPLRTNEQAGKSEIKDTAYSQSDMKELLHMLMESGGNMLLFTQNVTKIEMYHLPANATDPSQSALIYTATKNMVQSNSQSIQTSNTFNILKEVSALHSPVRHREMHTPATQKIIQTDINIHVEKAAKRFTSCEVSDSRSSTRWIISYATGTSKSMDISKQTKGVLPLAGVATPIQMNGCDVLLLSLDKMPFGFYKTGHYFCFLPLPIETRLPVHINATFAVAPDRRSIMWGTEDDRIELVKPRWNHSLMTDAVPNAYISLLEILHNYTGISDEEYMNIWPIHLTCSNELQNMQKAFLTKVVKGNQRVFKRHAMWAGFEGCKFMDPTLLESDVGGIAYKAAIHFLETDNYNSTKVMRLQKDLDASFSTAGLGSTIKTKMFSTEDFFTEILFPEMQSDFWESRERNRLVMFAVDNISETTKNLLQNSKCFPSEPTGELKCPHDLVHPDSKLKDLFTTGEGRFVNKEMIEAGIRERKKQQLANIGMIVDTLPRDLVLDRVESVLSLSTECAKCAIERSVRIVKYIKDKCMSDTSFIDHLKDVPYLPILQKPKNWTFPWKADCQYVENCLTILGNDETVSKCNHVAKENVQFAKPRCLYLTRTQQLVGSQELVMDMSCYTELVFPIDLFARLGVSGEKLEDIPINVVCTHLIQLCETIDPVKFAEDSKHLLKKTCNVVYTFLNTRMSSDTISKEEQICIEDLKEHPVVFCHNIFVKPNQTALSILMDCEPYLFGLQIHHLGSKCQSLVRVLDIKNQFTTDDVLNVMLQKQKDIEKEQLTEEELELYTKLIKVLVKCMDRQTIDCNDIRTSMNDEGVSTRLCIPDINGVLAPIDELCLNDNEKIGTTGTMKFVNGKIGPDFARKLGVKAKIKQHFSDHTRKMPFGQKEELTTRIREILRGYPCDEGIMKELLQNADDAQATELQFIVDGNTYSAKKVFDDKWKPLQGPALLVYNNSMFSAKDIQGIQNLGIGSKGEDPTKTGQYGVGFNAVYHLTDAPSFLTKGPNVEGGETMCVMDPHCQFLSDATEERPGIQFMNLHEHRDLYPDVFKCYHEDKLLTDRGTVFRFPLRTNDETKKPLADPLQTKDETRKPLADPMSSEKLRNLLKTFERELLESLLFVNSVKKITLSDISSGECKIQYEVETIISKEDEEKRTAFGNHVRDISRKFRDTQDLSNIQNESVSYNVTVNDSKGVSNTWLVVQHIGFGDGDIPTEVLDAYQHRNLGLLPRGGVAILLSSQKSSGRNFVKPKYKAFCFLPLPIQTGLSVHVNGHFALGGDTRSSLWNEERRTYRWEWNKLLLSRVIPSAYIMGMEIIKEMLLTDVGESSLVKTTRQLDDLFPIFKEAKDENWKLVAKEVLNQIYNDQHELFYMDMSHGSNVNAQPPPLFVPLKQTEEFPAVFNTLINHKRKTVIQLTWQDRQLLAVLMKGIGLRLLDSSTAIFDSMKDVGIPVSEISPEAILEFMKSFNRTDIEHRCNITILEGGTDLSNTSLQNQEKVFTLLQYCRDSEEFASGIIDVPMCLTQDGKLRVFKEGCEIFCSELFSILPCSVNRFLHQSLVLLCDIEELHGKVFKSFDIPSFGEFLAESLSPEKFRKPRMMVDWLPMKEHIPNSLWICKVWKFLAEQLKKSKGKYESDGSFPDGCAAVQTIPQELVIVSHWNLVPCTFLEKIQNHQTTRTVLSSLSGFDKVLNLGSFTGELKNALEKLALPVFDTNALQTPILSSLIPYDKKPAMVLNCLHFHCKEQGYEQLSNKDADAILEYFVDNIKEVQKLDDWKIKLKSLPLHRTVHGERVSLEIERKVLVLPAYIPTDGIKEWGQASRTLLLKQNPKLKSLYEAFEYTESNMCDVYTSHILANVGCLPRDCIPVHLVYIRDNLLLSFDKYNPDQRNLIAALQKLCIFDTERGGIRCASGLHSPHVSIFRIMCNQLHFPVAPFDGDEWRMFMELIGMVQQASNELIIQFARQIEEEGRHSITDEVLKKSKLLLKYIWNIDKLENSDLLSNIRTIKFINPSTVSEQEQAIYLQYEAGQLMAFEGAVPKEYTKYVWSTCNILTEIANPFARFHNQKKSGAIVKQLQTCMERPPLEKVIQHAQNICDALKEQCERNVWEKKEEYLKSLMSDIYEYLWEHGAKQNSLCERLRQKPIMYMPSENKFVTCGVLAIYLDEFGDIKPYLYSAPTVFGRFFELFETLGTEKRPTCTTYARVLEKITRDVTDQELHANERQSVKKAIGGLFTLLRKEANAADVCLQVPILYLPTKDKKMMDSTQMIYSNNKSFYDAIGKGAGLPYFIGFQSLLLKFFDYDIERLPVKYRPLILTNIVETRVDVTHLDVTQGRYTKQLEEFIRRPEFVEGLLRISHHDKIMAARPGTEEVQESSVVSGLQKIKVLQVKALTVDYVYKENVLGCNTVFSHIHTEKNDEQTLVWNLYTNVPEGMERTDWLMNIEKEFVQLIWESTNIDCLRHRSVILKILVQMDRPERISYILDKEDYREYHISETLMENFIPGCGTYVNEKWHHMLDNTTFTFDEGEFVALQLHDEETMDADKSREESDMYIYARIVKLIGSDVEGELSSELTKYEVDVGENRILIKFAYELYKILRKKTDSRKDVHAVDIAEDNKKIDSQKLVHAVGVANDIPADPIPLQVIFREVRKKLKAVWALTDKRERKLIFKRYMRKWHPDKNIGNEEQATAVFKYIQFVWDRLTNGDPVNDDDDADPSDYSHSRPSPNRDFYDDIFRQCYRERQRYQKSSRSSGGYRTSHAHDSDPVSNPMQQRKWFKQAELDLGAAEHFLESAEKVQGYNWICYMSHQVTCQTIEDTVTSTTLDPTDPSPLPSTVWSTQRTSHTSNSVPPVSVRNGSVTDINSYQRDNASSSEIKDIHQSTPFTSSSTKSSSVSTASNAPSSSSPSPAVPTVTIVTTSSSPETVTANPSIFADATTTPDVTGVYEPTTSSDRNDENKYTPSTTPDVNNLHKPTTKADIHEVKISTLASTPDVKSAQKPTTKADMHDVKISTLATTPDVKSAHIPITKPDMHVVEKPTSTTTPDVSDVHKFTPTTTPDMHGVYKSTISFSKADIVNNGLLTADNGVTPELDIHLNAFTRTGEPTTMAAVNRTDEPTTMAVVNRTSEPTMAAFNGTVEPKTMEVVNRTGEPTMAAFNRTGKPTTMAAFNRTGEPTTMAAFNRTGEPITMAAFNRTGEPTTMEVINRTAEPTTMEVVNRTGEPTMAAFNRTSEPKTTEVVNRTGEPTTIGAFNRTGEPTMAAFNRTGEPTMAAFNRTGEPTMAAFNRTSEPKTMEVVNRTGEPTMAAFNRTGEPTMAAFNRTGEPTMAAFNGTGEPTMAAFNRTGEPTIAAFNRTSEPKTTEVVNRTDEPTTIGAFNRTGEPTMAAFKRTGEPTMAAFNRTSEPKTMEALNRTGSTSNKPTPNISEALSSESTSTTPSIASTSITSVSSDSHVVSTNSLPRSIGATKEPSTATSLPPSTRATKKPSTTTRSSTDATADLLTTKGITEGHKTTGHQVSKNDQVGLGETSPTTELVTGNTTTFTGSHTDNVTTQSVEKTTQNQVVNFSQNTDRTSAWVVQIRHQMGDADDDTYWPIAIAVTVGVPVIIVFAITITVLNRKRKLEKAHNAALSGYITPPTEYDA